MSYISNHFQHNNLKNNNINIKNKYIVGNKILERNTDNSINDDINNGILCEKDYFLNNILIHTEKIFDSRIEYSFISKENDNAPYSCPNCGMNGKIKDFLEGCPYCGTHYNIDYSDKNLGSKYHYDLVLKNTSYRIVCALIDILVSTILMFFFIKYTSRTFNIYDISKIIIYGLLLSLILYYFFYIADALIILNPIKKYKEKQNQKQIDFWERTKIDKKKFFNNLNYEIGKYYYKNSTTIDYDILDYTSFQEYYKDGKMYVEIQIDGRIVKLINKKIKTKYIQDKFTFMKNENKSMELKDGIGYISCHNCGASIDITKDHCEYCHSKIKYLQEWILVDNKK